MIRFVHSRCRISPERSLTDFRCSIHPRFYATHSSLSNIRHQTLSSPGSRTYGNKTPLSNLLKPGLFTLFITGGSLSLAYWADTSGYSPRDPDSKLKTLTAIIALNGLVFGAWYLPPYWKLGQITFRYLNRYATVDPSFAHRYPASLLVSGFSHTEIWHFGLNMLGLYTIGNAVYDILGRNQFLAVYGSSIVLSSFASLVVSTFAMRRGITPVPSLGASGGIYALLGMTAWYVPNASVYFIFFPFIPIKLSYAFGGLICMDAAGLVMRWKRFDHAAHLAGGMTGLTYSLAGVPERWIKNQRKAMSTYMSRYGR